MNPTQRREQFRAILAGDRCVHPASVFDPISARIAEDLGFEVAFMAGSIASATVLGAPDLVVLTLTERCGWPEASPGRGCPGCMPQYNSPYYWAGATAT